MLATQTTRAIPAMSTEKEELPVAQLVQGSAADSRGAAGGGGPAAGASAADGELMTPEEVEAVLGKYDRVIRRINALGEEATDRIERQTKTLELYSASRQADIWQEKHNLRRFYTFPPELVKVIMDPTAQARELRAETSWDEVDLMKGAGNFAAAPISDSAIEGALFAAMGYGGLSTPSKLSKHQCEMLLGLHRKVESYVKGVGHAWEIVYRGGRATPLEVAAKVKHCRDDMVAQHFYYVERRAEHAAKIRKAEREYRDAIEVPVVERVPEK